MEALLFSSLEDDACFFCVSPDNGSPIAKTKGPIRGAGSQKNVLAVALRAGIEDVVRYGISHDILQRECERPLGLMLHDVDFIFMPVDIPQPQMDDIHSP